MKTLAHISWVCKNEILSFFCDSCVECVEVLHKAAQQNNLQYHKGNKESQSSDCICLRFDAALFIFCCHSGCTEIDAQTYTALRYLINTKHNTINLF